MTNSIHLPLLGRPRQINNNNNKHQPAVVVALRQHFLLIVSTIFILASNLNPKLSINLLPTVHAYSTGAGHCQSGPLTGKFSGHGESGGGPLSNGSLQVKFSGDNSPLQAKPLGSTKVLNPNQPYTVTLNFNVNDANFVFKGFLFRLSDRNGNTLSFQTMTPGTNTAAVQSKFGCGSNVSAVTHTGSSSKQRISFDFEYTDSSYAELLLEVTVVKSRSSDNWFYSAFDLQVGTLSTPTPSESTPAPVKSTPTPSESTSTPSESSPTPCVDKNEPWVIGNKNPRNWCGWARKQADTMLACELKKLHDDCPVTCESCPSSSPTIAPLPVTPAPFKFTLSPAGDGTCSCTDELGELQSEIDVLKATLAKVLKNLKTTPGPAPVSTPAPIVCVDKNEPWVIGNKNPRNWCGWARKQADTMLACDLKKLDGDCPVTCGICVP